MHPQSNRSTDHILDRRDFMGLVAGISASATVGVAGYAFTHLPAGEKVSDTHDKYGGFKKLKFKATGFFRTEKADRWWLVTPEGHGFLSYGINHFTPYLFKQAYNQKAWQARLGLQELKGPKFNLALRDWFFKTCEAYGFNTAGVHNHLPLLNQPRAEFPYMQPIKFVDTPHWKGDIPEENFVDIFAPAFSAHCDKLAKRYAAPNRQDPYLIGYTMTDCTLFTEEDLRERTDVIGGARRKSRIGWPRRLRNLPGSAPGKQAYVKLMRDIYFDSIKSFNRTYGTSFENFDALLAAVNWRTFTQLSNSSETRDNVEFLKMCVDRYYKEARDAIRRYDPNHMFIGDKLNANTDSADTVIPITTRYTDLVMYQMYARYEVQEPALNRWNRLTDKPFINGDSAFTMVTKYMPRPYGPVADTLEQRAEWTEEFFRKAFARPDFVGWHYCGLIDATNQNPRKLLRQHSGLLDSYGNPYENLRDVLKTCSQELYEIAT